MITMEDVRDLCAYGKAWTFPTIHDATAPYGFVDVHAKIVYSEPDGAYCLEIRMTSKMVDESREIVLMPSNNAIVGIVDRMCRPPRGECPTYFLTYRGTPINWLMLDSLVA